MTYLSKKVFLYALLGLFSAAAWGQTADGGNEGARTVVVGVDHSPPYRILDAGRQSGLYLDIFNEVADRLGWQVEYEQVPFRRILLLMQEGKVDVMLGPVRTENRAAYMAYATAAFPPERRLFFYREPENRVTQYSDLYGKSIGVLEGARYFERFDKDDQLKKSTAPRYQNLMLMLEKGRVEVVVAPELAGISAARDVQVEVEVSPFSVPGERSWIAISRKSPILEYADEIAEVVEAIRQEGLMERLVTKYSNLAVK
ncbi:transporter substrate-binding domain-containing protein [Marinobacter nauticus]